MMTPFERAVRGELEGSRGGRAHVQPEDDGSDRATPLSGTQLPPPLQRAHARRLTPPQGPSPTTAAARSPERVDGALAADPEAASQSTDDCDRSGHPCQFSGNGWPSAHDPLYEEYSPAWRRGVAESTLTLRRPAKDAATRLRAVLAVGSSGEQRQAHVQLWTALENWSVPAFEK